MPHGSSQDDRIGLGGFRRSDLISGRIGARIFDSSRVKLIEESLDPALVFRPATSSLALSASRVEEKKQVKNFGSGAPIPTLFSPSSEERKQEPVHRLNIDDSEDSSTPSPSWNDIFYWTCCAAGLYVAYQYFFPTPPVNNVSSSNAPQLHLKRI